MEIKDTVGKVRLNFRVPDFRHYSPSRTGRQIDCKHTVQLGAARATFKITLDLYAEPQSYRETKVYEWKSPSSKPSPRVSASRQITPKFPVKNSPLQHRRNVKLSDQHDAAVMKSPVNAYGCSPSSPRIKKSALQELYTKGGIEEIIHGDSQWPSKNASPNAMFKSTKSQQIMAPLDGDQFDVRILVDCIHTNIPAPLMCKIKITSGIGDRPEQRRDLTLEGLSGSKWRGLLVPRVSVKPYDLLIDGALNAWLEFTFTEEVLHCSPDSLVTLSRDLRSLLQDHHSSADAELITTDGGRIPAHLAVLKARSSLLSTCKILSKTDCDIALMVDGRSPNVLKPRVLLFENSSGVESSDSNLSYDGAEKLSPERYCTSVKISCTDDTLNVGLKSPVKLNLSPVKRNPLHASPVKLASSERLALFSRRNEQPSNRKPLTEKSINDPTTNLSDEESQIGEEEKSLKDLNQCFIECNDTKDSSLTSMMDGVPNIDEDDPITELKENFSRLNTKNKSPLISSLHKRSNHKHQERVLIQVNMSSSVTRQFIEWVYTGECSNRLFALQASAVTDCLPCRIYDNLSN
ncbi:uncharacterized protein LOC108679253 [Hyalella azteca]|uniref:Uncharacterized protein LOC108679253 n=1 Tax=Hyalella azteca TaxID=294128 RepID=A0A8B7PDI7_HYAAZ|nr:uncharacterized protein LOC108679253 [Hyalella azteca]